MIELKFIIMLLCLTGSFFKFRPDMLIIGIVEIENGKIVGNRVENYFEFLGLPYAEPPVGELRFAKPKKYSQTWNNVKEFKNYSDVCAQYDHFGYQFHGKEDCLTLNVYVPQSVLNSNILVPVIVYIHGGAFMFGGGWLYGAKFLMRSENVILVTINYRLGVLGFLSTKDEVIPGNFGLKDQVEALRWVQNNIEAFKGDPSKVTISGFSAGGASVHLHYLSQISEGLFANGISHSGVAINPWVMMEKAERKSYELADHVKCPKQNHTSLLDCLREKSPEELVMFAKHYQPFLYNPFSPFGVSVESPHDGAFLTQHPFDALKAGSVRQLPWIVTQTQDEGLYPAVEFFDDKILRTINDDWMKLAPFLFDYDSTTDDESMKKNLSKKIRQEYLGKAKINKSSYSKLLQIFTDRLYHNGALQALELQSSTSPECYFYYFRYQKNPADALGVSHGDDVFLIYENLDVAYPFDIRDLEGSVQMSHLLTDLYDNFSLSSSAIFNGIEMRPVTPKEINCLEIFSPKNFSTVKKDRKFGNVNFWKNLNIKE